MRLPQLPHIENKLIGKVQIGAGALLACLVVVYWAQGPSKTDTPAQDKATTHLALPLPTHSATVATNAPSLAPAKTTATQPQADTPAAAPVAKSETIHYQIKSGDTLEGIFKSLNLPIQVLYSILDTDEPYLVLDVIQPGDKLNFELDADKQLKELSLAVDPSKTVAYIRNDDNSYSYKETNTPVTWVSTVLHGRITGSFYNSAMRTGLDEASVVKIGHLLSNRFSFQRDLRAGDRFDVVISEQNVNGVSFGQPRIDAVQMKVQKQMYNAFLFSDGNYYDDSGNSLTPALLRYPLHGQVRVTSNFNPHRLNPVTHRVSPHNGVDFGVPVGTPVYSTGDGVVTRATHQRFAGNYIVINFDGPYATRYMHLSKFLVHKGQRIKRGQKIALSGNTGRSTGPHLHYELHIKDRPVNPITAKIPTLKSVPKQEMAEYRHHVESMEQLMTADETQVVQNSDKNATPKHAAGKSEG